MVVIVGGSAGSAFPPSNIADPYSNPPDKTEIAPDTAAHLAILRDTGADRAARDAAADALLQLAHRPQVAQELAAILENDAEQEIRGPLLRSIARMWSPPGRLFTPLTDLARRAEPQRAVNVLPAIGAFATRDAAEVLIEFLDARHHTSLRDAAAAALVRMTGRDDLRNDAAAWAAWLDAARGLSDREWRDVLAEGVWRRADRIDADRRAMGERLAEGFRRLYIVTPSEERPRLLSQMMLDPRAELRDVGLEIVSRELAGGRSMEGPVIEAAVQLLRSRSARVRAQAASLIAQVGPASAALRIIEAIGVESDPQAAAAMLQAIARTPEPEATAPVLRWLAPVETRIQALDAAFALYQAGHLVEDEHHAVVLEALRSADPSQLTVSAVRLLAFIGNDGDRQRLALLLHADRDSTRVAAAEALAEFPQYVELILQAAEHDPAIFAPAVRAASSWRNTIAGLLAISELEAPSEEEHRAGLLRVAASLPMVALLAVASSNSTDLTLREALLARVLDRQMGPFLPGDEDDLETLGECILLLAETRLAMNRPDRALAALQELPTAWSGSNSPRTVRLHVIAMLWTNRIAAAAELDAPAAAWLDAAELAIEEAHAGAIVQAIRTRWSESLTDEEQARLDTLAQQIGVREPASQTEPQDDPPSPPPAPQ